MTKRIGTRVHSAFRWRGLRRPQIKMEILLGCTYDQLVEYLGPPTDIDTVTVDHIIPISQYNLQDPVDVMRVFNYRNLQLLTDTENKYKARGLPDNETLMNMKQVWPHSWGPRTTSTSCTGNF